MKKTYLARIVVHFTAEVEAEEGRQDQAAADLGDAINERVDHRFFESMGRSLPRGTKYLSAGVMETLIEGAK